MRPNSKTMQKKLAAYARMKAEAELIREFTPIDRDPPKRLISGQPGAGMWDVYFNGERQHLCTFADVQLGRITRYKHGRGSTGIGKDTENLIGHVEIVRKGDPSTFVKAVAEVQEFVKANPQRATVVMPRRIMGSSRVLAVAAVAMLAAGVKVSHED